MLGTGVAIGGVTSNSLMNSFNALGFLALGSLMNAVPALAPSLVARGPLLGDMTTSAIWLHFMGVVLGLIGGVLIIREGYVYHTAARALPVRVVRPVAVPRTAARTAPAMSTSAQAA